MRRRALILGLVLGTAVAAQQGPNPRQQPGATITVFAPEQHDLYDGHFVLSASRIYMVGGLNDAPGWDHMDNAAATVKPVTGTVEHRRQRPEEHGDVRGQAEDSRGRSHAGHRTGSTSSTRARTAGSSPTSTSTAPILGAATTTGPRRSSTWPGGGSATRRSTGSRCIRTTKCTSWSRRASATGRRCASITRWRTRRGRAAK